MAKLSGPVPVDTRITWAECREGLPDTLASRGYREAQEHLGRPRCHPEVGLADAVVTLVSNMAARTRRRIEFRDSWFQVDSDEAPERG